MQIISRKKQLLQLCLKMPQIYIMHKVMPFKRTLLTAVFRQNHSHFPICFIENQITAEELHWLFTLKLQIK